jgi:outer membrane lipoprotein carrier protein
MRNSIKKSCLVNTCFAILAFFGIGALSAYGLCESQIPVKRTLPKGLTVSDVSQKVEEAQTGVQDAQMNLEMEMKDTLSGAQQKTKGALKLKSPDKVYVHYTQPEEQFLYAEGSLVRMYQPSQKTVFEQRAAKGQEAAPLYVGVGKQLKQYISVSKVSIIKETESEVGLLLIAKDSMSAGFDRMKVFIHKKDWWPYQMEVETPSMNSKIRFSDFSFNKGLKDELFKFTPPKGVRVEEGSVF